LQKSLHLSMSLFLTSSFYTLPGELFSFRGQVLGLTGSLMCLWYSALSIICKSGHYYITKNSSPICAIEGFNPTVKEGVPDVCSLCASS